MSDEIEKLKTNYDVHGHIEEPVVIPRKPESGLVLLVGSSGSGKSTILRNWFGDIDELDVDENINTIELFSSVQRGEKLLVQCGLRSIPTWFRPLKTLSNGERHRALTALGIDRDRQFVDEFTSVVDRDTAKSLSWSLRKNFTGGLLVIATCHHDVEEWLCPDIIYDTDKCQFVDRRYLRRPDIRLDIRRGCYEDWVYFKKHHYLASNVNRACHFYVATIDEKKVGFVAVIHRCGGHIRTYWGESRLVVLPEFQGLGIGTRLSDAIADEYVSRGLRYQSKTAHPVLGEHRQRSPLWKPTSSNLKLSVSSYLNVDGTPRLQKGFGKTEAETIRDANRLCYSHEYIGANPSKYGTYVNKFDYVIGTTMIGN